MQVEFLFLKTSKILNNTFLIAFKQSAIALSSLLFFLARLSIFFDR